MKRLLNEEVKYSAICAIASELADDILLKKYMQDNKPSGLAFSRDPDVAVSAVRQTMITAGFRVILFEHFPMQYFMCPVDGFMCAAEIMVKMDRNGPNDVFNKLVCYIDGGHKDIRPGPNTSNPAVYKACTVIPDVGLVKLAVTVLPAGESSEFLIHFWKGINKACRLWLDSNGRSNEAKDYNFSPYAWCGDSAGGQWLALREVYNIHIEKGMRGKTRVTDTGNGRCLEIDCDLHLEKDIAMHAKRTHDKFISNEFVRLARDWYKVSLSPSAVLAAENNLKNFIECQENKIVKKDLTAWFDFYVKEGERVLHLFREPMSGKAECLMSVDNRVLGRYSRKVDWVHKTISGFIVQAGKMKFIHEGGQPRTSTSSHVESRRTQYYQQDVGDALGKDLMQQVSNQYRMIADDNAKRSHRADKRRRETPTVREESGEVSVNSPKILNCKVQQDGDMDLFWLVDDDPENILTEGVWRETKRVTPAEMLAYTLKVHTDTATSDHDARVHMSTQQRCNYRRVATIAQAKNILRTYAERVSLKIQLVLEPTRMMNNRMRITDEISQRGFVMNDNAQVIIGRNIVDCDCDMMRALMRGATSNLFQWCKHILYIMRRMGKVPGDFELVQCGFTPLELKALVHDSAHLKEVSYETPTKDEGVWMVVHPTSRISVCQGTHAIGQDRQCKIRGGTGEEEGVIGSKDPKIVVWGKRFIGGKWLKNRFTFHVSKTCVNNQFDPKNFKIGTPPMMYMVQGGYELPEHIMRASGLDIRTVN